MKKPILAFAASNSKRSINKQLVSYTASLLDNYDVTLLDLNDFEMPIYSIDRENETGIPDLAYTFREHILKSEGIIISFAEHNGSYAVAFKNIFDWISRIDKNVWNDNPMLLMATSPGGRGGASVLETAVGKLQRMTNNKVEHFSLPHFKINFDPEKGIVDEELKKMHGEKLSAFTEAVCYSEEVL